MECTLLRVLAVFMRSKVNRFGEIWSTLSTLWGLALTDFGREPRSIATAKEPGKILFFLSGKHVTISPVYRRPNFAKFEHNMSIGEAIKTFGTEF